MKDAKRSQACEFGRRKMIWGGGQWVNCGFRAGSPLPDPLTGSFRAHEVELSTWSSRTKDKRS